MSASGINALMHVAQQKVDLADHHAADAAETQRQTLGQRSRLDHVLASTSVLEPTAPATTEAALDALIGLGAQLACGDVQKDLSTLKDTLDGLRATKASLLARMSGADPAVLKDLSSQLAKVEVQIKDVMRQIQALEAAENDAKASVEARGDRSSAAEAQLEKAAQSYQDLLQSFWP